MNQPFVTSPSVCASSLNKEEQKICTVEQRRRNLSVMHKRTQRYSPQVRSLCPLSSAPLVDASPLCRLYEQLEEVKQQRAARSRREDNAKNRLKAKEFHKVFI